MKLPNPRMVTSFLVSLALIIYCATVADSVGRQNKAARITAMKISTLDSEGGKLGRSKGCDLVPVRRQRVIHRCTVGDAPLLIVLEDARDVLRLLDPAEPPSLAK